MFILLKCTVFLSLGFLSPLSLSFLSFLLHVHSDVEFLWMHYGNGCHDNDGLWHLLNAYYVLDPRLSLLTWSPYLISTITLQLGSFYYWWGFRNSGQVTFLRLQYHWTERCIGDRNVSLFKTYMFVCISIHFHSSLTISWSSGLYLHSWDFCINPSSFF